MTQPPPYLHDLNTLCSLYIPQLQSLFQDTPVILLRNLLAGSTIAQLNMLRTLGAQPALVIHGRRGSGSLPDPTNPEHHTHSILNLNLPKTSNLMETFRSFDRALLNLSQDVLDAIERYDPEGRALVVAEPPLIARQVAGRARLGARPGPWLDLEDKVVIDAFWERWNIPHAPHSEVSARDFDALWDAHMRHNQGMGTVWNADATEGWHGGAVFLRWVHTREDAENAFAALGPISKVLRVMPFLDGLPCSIHGFVLPSTTIALRPVEMVVLRNPKTRAFLYAGLNTWWDPNPEDRETMRSIAKMAGEGLRTDVGYRGAFTVDGIMTRDGFLPTELNPRYGAALYVMGHTARPLPLDVLDMAIKEDIDLTHNAALLESTLLRLLDDQRAGGAWSVVPCDTTPPNIRVDLVRTSEGWTPTTEHDQRTGTLSLGEAPAGCFVRYSPNPQTRTKKEPIAPELSSLFKYINQEFNLNIQPFEAAPQVRTYPTTHGVCTHKTSAD